MKKRLDVLMVEQTLVKSRERAKALILARKVFVDNILVTKAGKLIDENSIIKIKEDIPFVSRGGIKLQKAIDFFNISVKDKICLDIGASTGGFTDCLLQNGAKKVYAVDVGYGQLDWKLRNDNRVVVIERCNFRYIEKNKIPEKIELITVDTSFISLKLIIPKALEFLKIDGEIIALIKPQFEVGKEEVEKGGIVKDLNKHQKVINDLKNFFKNLNLDINGVIPSPIKGAKGNTEYLIYMKSI